MESCFSPDSLGNTWWQELYAAAFYEGAKPKPQEDVKEVRPGGVGNNARCREEQLMNHRTTLLATV